MEIWKCRNYWIVLQESKKKKKQEKCLNFSFSRGGRWEIGFLQSCGTISIHYLEYINKSVDFHSLVQRLAIFF